MFQFAPAVFMVPPAAAIETVLVVEDEAMVCEIAAEALALEGYRVLTAADADEAGRILAQEEVDMLFTDIDLARNTNGVALARDARRHHPTLPVVYTSGGRQSLRDGEAVSGSVFVPKPYRPSQIVALANRILGH
ncbi:response regulator [uncultured Methylobacterium sp.]|jgi:DNA-binding NtrC family response regulator|uniref:response regulator n=1 Tax=uncultured Methylobacterium sp. TaxID=157278 RepID=UPI002611188B|nr:response regulator [uncultured Methylobacterium sp.]